MSQREQATERMIQGASRKQLSSGDGYRHATRQSSESCRNNKVRVARDSVVFVHTRRFSSWTEASKGGIHEQTFVFTGRVRVHILTED